MKPARLVWGSNRVELRSGAHGRGRLIYALNFENTEAGRHLAASLMALIASVEGYMLSPF